MLEDSIPIGLFLAGSEIPKKIWDRLMAVLFDPYQLSVFLFTASNLCVFFTALNITGLAESVQYFERYSSALSRLV